MSKKFNVGDGIRVVNGEASDGYVRRMGLVGKTGSIVAVFDRDKYDYEINMDNPDTGWDNHAVLESELEEA